MAKKKVLSTDAEVKAEVDELLGQFGVIGEAEADFHDGAPPAVKDGERRGTPAPSANEEALWGGGKKKK